jgi:hypothetical protein
VDALTGGLKLNSIGFLLSFRGKSNDWSGDLSLRASLKGSTPINFCRPSLIVLQIDYSTDCTILAFDSNFRFLAAIMSDIFLL